MQLRISLFIPVLASCLVLLLGACDQAADLPESAEKPRKSGKLVTISTIEQRAQSAHYQRTGTLRHRRILRIYSQEEGRVIELPVYEGDNVNAGDLLARLDEQLLLAELDKAEATTRQAQVNLNRIIDLDKRQVASQDELTRARTALEVARADEKVLTTRIGYARITAPFNGVITERLVEPGDVKARHSHLLTLADPASLITEITVSELLLPHLHTGQPVDVAIDALGSRVFTGKISRIHPALDPITHHGKLEITLDPVPGGARAGQFVRVTLTTEAIPRLMIPFRALRRDRSSEYVFIHQDGRAVRKEVRSGIHIETEVEILDGLQPGQQVITQGFLGLSNGKKIKVVSAGDG